MGAQKPLWLDYSIQMKQIHFHLCGKQKERQNAVPKIALYPIKKAIPSLDEGAQIFYTSERYGIEGTAPFLETAMEDALALILRISGIGIPSIRPVKK